jgi:UDP-glucose 4-epimerase
MGEELALHWSKVYGLPVVSLRLFNVYGTRSRTTGAYGAVFGVFLAQKLNRRPLTVVGDGTQTRDFTFVSDVCQAFLAAANSETSGEIMNVGSGNTYAVNELVKLLEGPVVYIPKRPGEPDCTFADISKIRVNLGWSPTVSLQKGVEIMLENINDWQDAPLWNSSGIENATKSWFKYLSDKSEVK